MEQYHLNNFPYLNGDRPLLGVPIVTTVRGYVEYEDNCRKYQDGWYVKGKDVLYDDTAKRWVKQKIKIDMIDHETGQTVTNTSGLKKGIVGVNDGSLIIGFFTPNPLRNGYIYTSNGPQDCMDVASLDPNRYRECYSDGMFYDTVGLPSSVTANLSKKQLKVNNANNVYNVEDDPKAFQNAIDIFDKSKVKADKDLKLVSRLLNNLTFGAELETINGTLPPHLLAKYGLIICKDGSTKNENGLYPAEFVTVPLKGAKGLQSLRELSTEISKRSDIDIKCSYHLHIGGVQITRAFMVSLYRLCYKIQNDVFKMFPYYKTKPDGIKEKNYCKKLPNIMSAFGDKDFNGYINNSFFDLFSMLSGGLKMDENYNIKAKRNPWGSNKWEMKTRYFWVNLINPIFGKHDTLEFRVHTPTLNPDKIVNWLLMCSAIVKFAENNTERCIKLNKISFEEVLNFYKDHHGTPYAAKLSDNLVSYYRNRCEYFAKDYAKGDYVSHEELTKDSIFAFNTTKIK